jgi:ferredoxin--NADP+ reductase
VVAARDFVGWYNGHPDFRDLSFDLAVPRAVVVGNGNVALDIARILTVDPSTLEDTEIAPAALAALRESRIEEVVVIGRRGPEHAAFTLPELVGLTATPGVTVGVDPTDLVGLPDDDPKAQLLRSLAPPTGSGRRITLRFGLVAAEVHGGDAVSGVTFAASRVGSGVPIENGPATVHGATGDAEDAPADESERIAAGLAVASIGYRGLPVAGLPFDDVTGTVPNDDGRVIDPASAESVPGTYVVGWIKRGPSGFIGTNKACSQDTIAALVDDYNAGRLPVPPQGVPAAGSVARASARGRRRPRAWLR